MIEFPPLIDSVPAIVHLQPFAVLHPVATQTFVGARIINCPVPVQHPVLLPLVPVAFRQLHVPLVKHLGAEVLFPQLPFTTHGEVLGHGQVGMALVQPQGADFVLAQLQIIQTHLKFRSGLSVSEDVFVRNELLGVDVLQVPPEGLAPQLLAELFAMGQVTHYGVVFQARLVHEEEPLVVVHPHVGQSGCVDTVGVLVVREGVGVELPEDVAHPRAWNLKNFG